MDNSKKPILKKDKEVLLADGLPAELPDDLKHNQCQKKGIFLIIVICSLFGFQDGGNIGVCVSAFLMMNMVLVLFWRDSSVFYSEREMSPIVHLEIALYFFLLTLLTMFLTALVMKFS